MAALCPAPNSMIRSPEPGAPPAPSLPRALSIPPLSCPTGVGEQHTALCQAIDIGCMHPRPAAHAVDPVIEIVDGDKKTFSLSEAEGLGAASHAHSKSAPIRIQPERVVDALTGLSKPLGAGLPNMKVIL